MKNFLRFATVSVSFAIASHAAPFMAIGDGAELFLTGSLGIRADDNIFQERNETDDVIFDITPGLDLTFGKDAQLKGALNLNVAFSNYADNSNLNTTLLGADLFARFDDGKLKLGFNVGFHETNQNAPDIRGLTRRDITSAGGNAEIEISQITVIAAGIAFDHNNYKRSGYADSDSTTIPLDFYYKWTPKVDLSVGYRYRDYQTEIGSDSTDHYVNVGARGEFSPKLSGKVTVGWNTRRLDRGGDESELGLDGSVAYEISPKTNLQLGASRDFGTSPQGAQQLNSSFNGSVTSRISEEWSVNAGLSFRAIKYAEVPAVTALSGTPAVLTTISPRVPGRTDDFFEFQLGTTYIVNQNIRLVGAYIFRDYSSDIASGEFKNNVFSVSASFRY